MTTATIWDSRAVPGRFFLWTAVMGERRRGSRGLDLDDRGCKRFLFLVIAVILLINGVLVLIVSPIVMFVMSDGSRL